MTVSDLELLGLTELVPLRNSGFGFDLQWFAAEDEGRTEDPTELKLKKAREEGKVAKSAELTSALVLLFPIISLGFLSPFLLKQMKEMMSYFLTLSTQSSVAGESRLFYAFMIYYVKLVGPIALIAFTAGLLANILQVGFVFSVKPITPDLNRISPNFIKFFQKSFFSAEAAFNLAKSIFKVLIIGIIAYLNIKGEIGMIIEFLTSPFGYSFVALSKMAFKILIEASIAMLFLALPDYFFQRRKHLESLKMSKQEIKEERKSTEGDPLVRNRLRERMREIMNQNMLSKVPEADVIVTNPTHFAVGMEWKREAMTAPMVTAKGQDNMALRIKEIARENDVPIVENKPLARALYAEVEIGDIIPEKYYQVMAVILAEVYRLNGEKDENVS